MSVALVWWAFRLSMCAYACAAMFTDAIVHTYSSARNAGLRMTGVLWGRPLRAFRIADLFNSGRAVSMETRREPR
jgi:hypothetical protein